jgi:hypothetical protein
MQNIRFNRKDLSRLFWSVVFERSEQFMHTGWPELRRDLSDLDALRSQAAYDTGSINHAAAYSLYSLVSYLQPSIVAEVGTFIGKSTLSIARAMEKNTASVVHTCDMSNSIDLKLPTHTKIVQYKEASSTQMFKLLKEANQKVDMIALDGRLMKEDLQYLSDIVSPKTVYVLDDFEGVEKGVSNALFLAGSDLAKSHLMFYPADSDTLEKCMIRSASTTAVLLPASRIIYTAQ